MVPPLARPRGRRQLLMALLLHSLLSGCHSHNTLLDDQFCQFYYQGDSSRCAALRSRVQGHMRGVLPTLELGGDGGRKASTNMLFLHGLFETAACWANQFDAFCGGPDTFCVAPSMFNHHPDVALRPSQDLRWHKQVEAYMTVISELNLTNITLVMRDAGVFNGLQLMYKARKASHLFTRAILLEAGEYPRHYYNIPDDHPYKGIWFLVNKDDYLPFAWPKGKLAWVDVGKRIRAYEQKDSAAARAVSLAPCQACRIAPDGAEWATGWSPVELVARYASDDTMYHHVDPALPPEEWAFFMVPAIPKHVQLLLLYNRCNGDPGHYLFSGHFLMWLDKTVNHHQPICAGESGLHGADHLHVWQSAAVNEAISVWFRKRPSPLSKVFQFMGLLMTTGLPAAFGFISLVPVLVGIHSSRALVGSSRALV